jgi:hypothetical protein
MGSLMALEPSNTHEKYDRLAIMEELADVLSRTQPEDSRSISDDVWRKANVEAAAKLHEAFKEMTQHGTKPSYAVGFALADAVRYRAQYLKSNA